MLCTAYFLLFYGLVCQREMCNYLSINLPKEGTTMLTITTLTPLPPQHCPPFTLYLRFQKYVVFRYLPETVSLWMHPPSWPWQRPASHTAVCYATGFPRGFGESHRSPLSTGEGRVVTPLVEGVQSGRGAALCCSSTSWRSSTMMVGNDINYS